MPQHVVLFASYVRYFALEALALLLPLLALLVTRLIEFCDEDLMPSLTEDTRREELVDRRDDEVFAHVDRRRMPLVLVRPATVVVLRVASVVGPAMPRVPDHPTTAVTQDSPPEQVRPRRSPVLLGSGAVAGALAIAALRVEFVEHPLWDERLVRWFRRPHPHLRRVGFVPSAATASSPAVVDLVPRVLRVLQDLGHAGLRPRLARSLLARRLRRWILLQIRVEPFSDRVESQPFQVPPHRHQRDGLTSHPVWFQPRLGYALRGFAGIGVPDLLGLVAVQGLADVVALADVCAEAAPRQLQHVEHFILGD
nr:hypothetical protein [Kibdelosporangium persicum]